jgi:hypothetical protein
MRKIKCLSDSEYERDYQEALRDLDTEFPGITIAHAVIKSDLFMENFINSEKNIISYENRIYTRQSELRDRRRGI